MPQSKNDIVGLKMLLSSIEDQLARARHSLDQIQPEANIYSPTGAVRKSSSLRLAERLLWEFDQRSEFLPAHYFADPAWMILLDLYVQTLRRRKVSVSSLCIAARVPATTALRWIATLTSDGLVSRENDPADKRRMFLKLSPAGQKQIDAYLHALSSVEEKKFRPGHSADIVHLVADQNKPMA